MSRAEPVNKLANDALCGLDVIVTRPHSQAAPLAAALRAVGALVHLLPTIEIEAVVPPSSALQGTAFATYDAAIFVSVNAVTHGVGPLLLSGYARLSSNSANSDPALAESRCPRNVLAVGPATAAALADYQITAVVPDAYSTEGLLASETLCGLGSSARVLIVRGQGGRETLAKALRSRGLQVDELAVYRRVLPRAITAQIARDSASDVAEAAQSDGIVVAQPRSNVVIEGLSTRRSGVVVAVLTSVESFDNLLQIVNEEERAWLARTVVFAVVSERIAAHVCAHSICISPAQMWLLDGAATAAIVRGLASNWAPGTVTS